MITSKDREFMRKARAETVAGRTHKVQLEIEGTPTVDKDTDEVMPGVPTFITVDAVVTEVNRGLGDTITLDNGVIVESFEAKFDISLSDWVDTERIEYNGKMYRRVADTYKGIGERNRIEVYAEVIR